MKRIVTAIFYVGAEHPLYKKPVKTIILEENCGYNGKCIFGKTLEKVHYEEDPFGIYQYDSEGTLIGIQTKPAYDAIWEGWIEKIIQE